MRALEYLAHPSAERRLAEIAASVLAPAEEPGDVRVAISHRIGALAIGDLALVCAVASPHRTAAFVHCGELVERVKSELPIWKRQLFVDGTDEWVNCP